MTSSTGNDVRTSHAAQLTEGGMFHRPDGPSRTVPVDLGDGRTYNVHIGPGVNDTLTDVIASVAPKARRAAIVTQQSVIDNCPAAQVDPGIEHRVFTFPEGEEHKSLSTVGQLCSEFAAWGMNRNDVVIAVGGGIITDVGGFAASVFHRGISVVYVSTTLLGMIDAAVGGKTGVNLPEGKNLVGAFWQPRAVLCDTNTLETLPPREVRCGLGEMAKYHFLGGEDLDGLGLVERIARCVEIKAEVVGSDEREGGRRAILNYGHTLAHALEIATDFEIRHGEAVAIGLIYAAELGHAIGRIDAARVGEHRRIVAGYDLSMRLPDGPGHEELIALMGRDKKALDGLTFVLDGPNGVETVTGIDVATLRAVMQGMAR